jgi:hypothetical protein
MPKRVWKKCMEFVVKNSAGKLEKHFIDPQTGTVQKVYEDITNLKLGNVHYQ